MDDVTGTSPAHPQCPDRVPGDHGARFVPEDRVTVRIDRPELPPHVRAGDNVAVLAAVLAPDVNLAIWQKTNAPTVMGHEMLSMVDDIGLTCAADRLTPAMRGALNHAGYPDPFATAIADDIAMLGNRLAHLLDRDMLAVRLEVIETDACRKFHSDYVGVRLICTYAGPATEWLDDRDAAALRNGADPSSLDIRRLATGDVALFKGRAWAPDGAIVHRSPPLAGTGTCRLVLVIDPAPPA